MTPTADHRSQKTPHPNISEVYHPDQENLASFIQSAIDHIIENFPEKPLIEMF
jgi:hypothetical protein